MSMQWTKEQEQAIRYQGPGELLVSAAAGSGKTAVLTERIIQTCLRDQVSPEDLVVLTFTDKAAANMRQRLLKKLRDLREDLHQEGSDQEAQVQDIINQVPLAAISTIHAFCLRLLQDQKDFLLDDQGQLVYPGQLRTLAAGEADMALAEALDQVLTDLYQAGDKLADPEAEAFFLSLQAWRPRLEAGVETLEGEPTSCPQAKGEPASYAEAKGEPFLSGQDYYQAFLRSQNISNQQSDDQTFRDRLIADYKFLRSLPDYQDWCQQAYRDLVQEETDFASSQACAYFLDQLPALVDQADRARLDLEAHPYYGVVMDPKTKSKQLQAFQDKYPLVCDFIQAYQQLVPAGQKPSSLGREAKTALWALAVATGQDLRGWQAISSSAKDEDKQSFRAIFYPNFGPLLQFLGDLFMGAGKQPKAAALEFGMDLPTCPFALSLDQIQEGVDRMLPVVDTYLATLFALDQAYQALKISRQQIDFSDYEHLAYQLLQREEVRDSLALKYRAILIDEYQDTSPLQEALLQSLLETIQEGSSRGQEAGSLTMLGDIKQSIYRFRHANPDIFRHKLEHFTLVSAAEGPAAEGSASEDTAAKGSGPEGSTADVSAPEVPTVEGSATEVSPQPGHLLLLKRNFRSQPALLEFINNFFTSFMRLETGEINYDSSQSLVPGREPDSFPRRQGTGQPFNLIYVQGDNKPVTSASNTPDASQLALYQAVTDLAARGFKPGEIAILARTHRLCKKAQDALTYWQLDSRLKEQQVFLQSDVQRTLTSLVQVLANFYQDIPLVAILRSDLHPYTLREDDLYKISRQRIPSPQEDPQAHKRQPSFADRFLAYAAAGEDSGLRARCQAFLALYQTWRDQAAYLSLADLLRRIVEASTWLDRLASQAFASDRLQDWEDFLSQAEGFGRRQGHSLSQFARYLESLADQKIDLEEADAGPSSDDVIQILTLHAAKGLEFPAVIYFESNYVGQDKEKSDPLAFLPDQGLAAHYPWDDCRELVPPRRLYFNQLVDFRKRAEDYRLLYVVMTRAEEVLYFTGSGQETDLAKLGDYLKQAREKRSGQGLSTDLVAQAKSDLDLLLASLALTTPDLVTSLENPALQGPLDLKRDDAQLSFYLADQLSGDLTAKAQPSLAGTDQLVDEIAQTPLTKAADFPLFPETPEAQNQVAALLRGDGLGPDLSHIPAKLTVSELKDQLGAELAAAEGRQAQLALGLREMALDLRRPEGPTLALPSQFSQALTGQPASGGGPLGEAPEKPLSPSQYGSLLHQIFQRLRPQAFLQEDGSLKAAADQLYAQAMEAEIQAQSLPAENRGLLLEAWPFVRDFLNSDLGRCLAQAEAAGHFVARELPFTLAVPAAELARQTGYPDLPLEAGALSLVQGMIDLFFDQGDGVILIDYKSDRLKGSQAERDRELTRRYQVQLDYYARAISQLRGRPVQAKIIWLIREGRAVHLT